MTSYVSRMKQAAFDILKSHDDYLMVEEKGSLYDGNIARESVIKFKYSWRLDEANYARDVCDALQYLAPGITMSGESSAAVYRGTATNQEDKLTQIRDLATLLADNGVNFPGSEAYRTKATAK